MTTIHHTVTLPATPDRVYAALATAAGHAAFTGVPATSDETAGGEWTAFGGYIHGRDIERAPGERLVQAWRSKDWAAGQWSVARFELTATGDGTRLDFHQAGHPDGTTEHLEQGWRERYWGPLTAYLGG